MPTIINDDGGFLHWPEEPEEVVDPKVLGDGWVDVGFMSDIEGTIFHAPGHITPKDISLGSIELTFEAADISPSTLSMLTGGDIVSEIRSPLSVVIDTTETASGAPPYPTIPTLDLPWWRILERRRIIAERERLVDEWEKAYADWVDEGRPDREIHIRRYIPNARIELED